MPGIVLAGGQDPRGIRGRRDPHAGPHVPHRARVLEQDERRRPLVRDRRRRVHRGSAGDRDHTGPRRLRDQLGDHLLPHGRRVRAQRAGQIRRQLGGQPLQPRRIRGGRVGDLGAEAQRVLEGVKALEDGQLGIASRRSIAPHQGIAHRSIMTRGRRR